MADSDGEYDGDDVQLGGRGSSNYGTRNKSKGKSNAWERSIKRIEGGLGGDGGVHLLVDGPDSVSIEQIVEARKRKRLRQDTKPFQRGIIRHVVLILDLSEAMADKAEWRPNRFIVTLKHAQDYVREFFEQNPISQMCVMGMHDGICIRLSDLSGNPEDHINAIRHIRNPPTADERPKEPKGSPSLQNALDLSRAVLYHTPSHGTREVIVIFGALLTLDPGDIHKTIRDCVRDRIRVTIIGIGARLKICTEICEKTNAGDGSTYTVAIDPTHFRELLMATTTPPVIRQTADNPASTEASLLQMGFPSRTVEDYPSLCACHGQLTRGGYTCPRCQAKVCSLPVSCPCCKMTLILSTHLARSYHHLFPLQNWTPVTWKRAREKGTLQCKACLTAFPEVPKDEGKEVDGEVNGNTAPQAKSTQPTASESSRYECQQCHNHFCIDCDLYCHEVVHNCPGCLSDGGYTNAADAVDGGAPDVCIAMNEGEPPEPVQADGDAMDVS